MQELSFQSAQPPPQKKNRSREGHFFDFWMGSTLGLTLRSRSGLVNASPGSLLPPGTPIRVYRAGGREGPWKRGVNFGNLAGTEERTPEAGGDGRGVRELARHVAVCSGTRCNANPHLVKEGGWVAGGAGEREAVTSSSSLFAAVSSSFALCSSPPPTYLQVEGGGRGIRRHIRLSPHRIVCNWRCQPAWPAEERRIA